MRVEVIGGLGVGKTTLCAGLTSLGFRCVSENLGQNQYLDLSYQNPESYGVYSQISFVLGNYFTFKQNTRPGEINIFDYSTINDQAYATLFLNEIERDTVLQTIDCMEQKEGRASLYLYLTCSPETQIKHIRMRGRDHERGVTEDFVCKLDSHLRHYAAQAADAGAKIITIDTDSVDLLADTAFVAHLGADIQSITGIRLRKEIGFQSELGLESAGTITPASPSPPTVMEMAD